MNNYKKYLLLLTVIIMLAILFYAYTKQPINKVKVSYYHWKNSYQVKTEQLKALQAHQLYIKFLDIGYSNQLEVISTRFPAALNNDYGKVIPVVYIDNRVLKHTSSADLLAIIKKKISATQYRSLQLDCDWTLSTRKRYFSLLRSLYKIYPDLSATIRLHQVKYFKKTGVPPVKTGVLMYYNMSDIRDLNSKNAILDLEIAQQYHVNFQHYPLPLNLAFPLYHQIRVIRQNKVVMILIGKALNHQKLDKIAPQHYRVNHSHYIQGHYLYEGDELHVDQVSEKTLKKAAYTLKPLLKIKELIFYELNYAKDFGYERIENIRRIFN